MRPITTTIQLTALVLAADATSLSAPARAREASFGCKALPCAAANAPSWTGISYCEPVRHQLFSDLARGYSWPVCQEGGQTFWINYEPYLACPVGTSPGGYGNDHNGGAWIESASGNLCSKLERGSGDCNGLGDRRTTNPRPKRDEPYNVGITIKGTATINVRFSIDKG